MGGPDLEAASSMTTFQVVNAIGGMQSFSVRSAAGGGFASAEAQSESVRRVHSSMKGSLRFTGVEAPGGPAAVSTWFRTGMNLTGVILGAGLLALPSVFANLGYVVSIALICSFSLLVMYAGLILLRVKIYYHPEGERMRCRAGGVKH